MSIASFAIHMHDRSEALAQASGMQTAERIADIVRLLQPLPFVERRRIVQMFSAPPLTIGLDERSLNVNVLDSEGGVPKRDRSRSSAPRERSIAMVRTALDFMRAGESAEKAQPVDINALCAAGMRGGRRARHGRQCARRRMESSPGRTSAGHRL